MLSEAVTYQPLLIQAQHWTAAAKRLADMDALAGDHAWESLERYLNLELRKKLSGSVERVVKKGEQLINLLFNGVNGTASLDEQEIERLKKQYMKVETMVDF